MKKIIESYKKQVCFYKKSYKKVTGKVTKM